MTRAEELTRLYAKTVWGLVAKPSKHVGRKQATRVKFALFSPLLQGIKISMVHTAYLRQRCEYPAHSPRHSVHDQRHCKTQRLFVNFGNPNVSFSIKKRWWMGCPTILPTATRHRSRGG